MTSTEIWLLVAVVALVAWNIAQQLLLRYHQQHLAANDERMDVHQRHLAALDGAFQRVAITPISAARFRRFEDAQGELDAKIHRLERSDGA